MANPLPGVISDSVWALVMDDEIAGYFNKFGWAKLSMFKDYASSSTVATDLLSTISGFLLIEENQFNVIKTIWGLVLPAACCLFVLYFLLNFTEEISGRVRDLDIRYWTMTIIKFAMATVFLQYGILLVVGIIDVGNSWINSAIEGTTFAITLSGTTGTSDAEQAEYLRALIRTIHDLSGVEAMIKCVLASIVNLITAIPAIIIIIQAISREITIILQGGLTPLAFADIYEHGTRSTAFTYLKKFAVALLHGLLMVWIIQICSSLAMSYDYVDDSHQLLDLSNWISIAKPVLYMFAEVGLIGASKSILNDVLGC